jgi:peptidylprolyl isomerase
LGKIRITSEVLPGPSLDGIREHPSGTESIMVEQMEEPRHKDRYRTALVYYEGRLDDGTVFDGNLDAAEPMPILMGRHEVIPGFENVLMEMEPGEKREVVISPDMAYGYPKQEAIQRSKLSLIKNGDKLEEGMMFKMRTPVSYYPVDGKVLHIYGDFVEIDFNHPLAGKDLCFTIELVDLI